jgi:hypothetical protein
VWTWIRKRRQNLIRSENLFNLFEFEFGLIFFIKLNWFKSEPIRSETIQNSIQSEIIVFETRPNQKSNHPKFETTWNQSVQNLDRSKLERSEIQDEPRLNDPKPYQSEFERSETRPDLFWTEKYFKILEIVSQ